VLTSVRFYLVDWIRIQSEIRPKYQSNPHLNVNSLL